MGATIMNETITTEPPPLDGQQPKSLHFRLRFFFFFAKTQKFSSHGAFNLMQCIITEKIYG